MNETERKLRDAEDFIEAHMDLITNAPSTIVDLQEQNDRWGDARNQLIVMFGDKITIDHLTSCGFRVTVEPEDV